MEVKLTRSISRRDDGLWIAVIREIPIASCGKTREEAWRNADNAVYGWFTAHERAGTFQDVLNEYDLKLSL